MEKKGSFIIILTPPSSRIKESETKNLCAAFSRLWENTSFFKKQLTQPVIVCRLLLDPAEYQIFIIISAVLATKKLTKLITLYKHK